METAFEQVLTNCYKDEMISYMDSHPEAFKEAIELAISEKQPYAWRAAWLLWSCMEENDFRAQGFVKRIIDTLATKNGGHQRELLKILSMMELNEEYEGLLFDICVSMWSKVNNRSSVRFEAFKVISALAKRHPDLTHEITFLTQNQYLETLSPGIKRVVAKMVKEIPI
ncbi:MAG: hypothetical protein GY816_20985 [Cytophagales bacterium]|nr:hypothetical protein [Cytophagales bacterium]